ncbi:MAG: hypothetical protein WCG95_02295, partial [bacterium]
QWDNSPIINISNTLQNLSGLQFQIANGSGTVEFDEIKFHSLLRNYVLVDDFEDNDLFDNFVNKH